MTLELTYEEFKDSVPEEHSLHSATRTRIANSSSSARSRGTSAASRRLLSTASGESTDDFVELDSELFETPDHLSLDVRTPNDENEDAGAVDGSQQDQGPGDVVDHLGQSECDKRGNHVKHKREKEAQALRQQKGLLHDKGAFRLQKAEDARREEVARAEEQRAFDEQTSDWVSVSACCGLACMGESCGDLRCCKMLR